VSECTPTASEVGDVEAVLETTGTVAMGVMPS